MDTITLVSEMLNDGERLVKQLPLEGFPATAAFWIKPLEDDRWYFYIVSPLVESEGLVKAYRRLHPVIRQMPQPFRIDPLEVKLIGPSNPLARDALMAQERTPTPKGSPIRWNGNVLGNVAVEGAYLYPLVTAAG